MTTLTTKRVRNGEFDVFWRGKPTYWQIINGSHGFTGPRNTYGIVHANGTLKWIGSLADCKEYLKMRFVNTIDGRAR